MPTPTLIGNRVQCPMCCQVVELVTVTRASRIAGVSRRSVYNYIEEGLVFVVRVAGKTTRLCPGCLIFYGSEVTDVTKAVS